MKNQEENRLKRTACLFVIFSSFLILGSVKLAGRQLVHQFHKRDISEVESTNSSFQCKHPTINEFPQDFVSFEDFTLFHLNLKEDVAGATFMAAGTSAPELFTSIIGVFIAKSDIGTGTIVGSAIFNVLFIIGVCGLAAKSALNIDFYPLTRDCIFYAISVFALMMVLYDGEINSFESIFLILLYAVYIVIMYYNDKLEKKAKSAVAKWNKKEKKAMNEVTFSMSRDGVDSPLFQITQDQIELNEREIDVVSTDTHNEDNHITDTVCSNEIENKNGKTTQEKKTDEIPSNENENKETDDFCTNENENVKVNLKQEKETEEVPSNENEKTEPVVICSNENEKIVHEKQTNEVSSNENKNKENFDVGINENENLKQQKETEEVTLIENEKTEPVVAFSNEAEKVEDDFLNKIEENSRVVTFALPPEVEESVCLQTTQAHVDSNESTIDIFIDKEVQTDDVYTEENEDYFNPFKKSDTKSFLSKAYWFITIPIGVIFYFTIPDCRRKKYEKFPYYFITFLVSTIYVGILTYGLVWMVVLIDTVAGLTVLAAGTSLPEVVSSIIITRQGKGEMAMSNSIGSNVFDILICLGVPWFLESTILKPFTVVHVYSGGIFYSAGVLLGSIVILMSCFILNKWKMNKKFGLIMFVLWTIVTVLTCLFEYDVFGKLSLPLC